MEKNSEKLHLRHCILHLYHCGSTGAEAARIIQDVYGKDAVNDNTCRRWFQRFEKGDFDLKDKKRGGRPQEIEDHELETLLEENPTQTTRELGQQLGVTNVTVSRRLNALGYNLSKKRRRIQNPDGS
uniref:Mos1 transposase HTH domain-containing protein n=1 Tax=Phlebotomus papatasi TaxID=29031 RepID=A0A1B0D2H0_PHLPP